MLPDLSIFLSRHAHPRLNIFLATFSEATERPDPTRPCLAPVQHSHSRIDKSNCPSLNPQQQQVWDVGSGRLITLRSRLYFSKNPF